MRSKCALVPGPLSANHCLAATMSSLLGPQLLGQRWGRSPDFLAEGRSEELAFRLLLRYSLLCASLALRLEL